MTIFRNAKGNVVTDVVVNPILTSGTHIVTINGIKVYAPNNSGGGGGSSQRLSGKHYITIGDSISYRNHFQQVIDDILGTTHANYAVSGAAISYFPFHNADVQPNPEGDTETTGWDRLLTSADLANSDMLIICGYANSIWSTLGTINDSFTPLSQADLDAAGSISAYRAQVFNGLSFYAQAKAVIDYFTRIYNKPILISGQLPMSRRSDSWNTGDATVNFKKTYIGGATARQISDALKEVANYFALPYVDLEREGGMNINNYTTYYDGTDTTHPNFKNKVNGEYPESGMKRMGVAIANAINKIL